VRETLKFAAALANRPGLDARQSIAVGILQARLRQRQGDPGAARRHLAVALRNAEAENLLAVLVEHGEFLAGLLPLVAAKPGPGNARLAAFADRVAKLLKMLPATPTHAKALAGVTRQEHRVLSYVTDGYTNKQIARALGSSEATVKFHLGNLFRKLGVSSRGALAESAAARGLRT
jgi:DNA-binding CsgD family transcriptional regulator